MPDEAKFPLEEAGVTALDVATASPVGTILSIAARIVGSFQARAGAEKAERAFATYLDEWATLRGLPPDSAAAEVERMLTAGTAEHDERLYSMFRTMAFSRCMQAWPYIARMTPEYINDGRHVDAFFRRCGWFFERCEVYDLVFLSTCMSEPAGSTVPSLLAEINAAEAAGDGLFQWSIDDKDDIGEDIETWTLLRESRLGWGTSGAIRFSFDHIRRLSALFGVYRVRQPGQPAPPSPPSRP